MEGVNYATRCLPKAGAPGTIPGMQSLPTDALLFALASALAFAALDLAQKWSARYAVPTPAAFLALRLASYYVFCEDDPSPGAAPVLILDDVFAELDNQRRAKLAGIVASAEQVIVTAAVAEDIPEALSGEQFKVVPGGVASGQETV